MIPRDTIKKTGSTFAHLALSMAALSGGANSYYQTKRQGGLYTPAKEMVAQLNAKPLSVTAIHNGDWQKSLEPVLNENTTLLALKKAQQARELIIVDGAVEDKSVIFKQAQPGVDIMEVPTGSDGMVELMKILSNYSNLDAVHIVSHAKSGAIQLGGQTIGQEELEEDVAGFAAINNAIREGGDLMLYGCDVAKDKEGDEFLEIIKNNTHVDVAASVDQTGNEAYGGNWELEIQKGDIEAKPLSESIAMKNFTSLLQTQYVPDDFCDSLNNQCFYAVASHTSSDNHIIFDGSQNVYAYAYYGPAGFYLDFSGNVYEGHLQFAADGTNITSFELTEVNFATYLGSSCNNADVTGYLASGGTVSDPFILSGSGSVNLENLSGQQITRFRVNASGCSQRVHFPLRVENFTVNNKQAPVSLPTVITTAEFGVGSTNATLGGEVTADGGATVTESGIVWGTSSSPDIDNDNVVPMSNGVDSFSQAVELLPFGTTIYYRAYATNGEGTAYGSEESFTTGSTVSVSLNGAEGWRLLAVPDDVSLATFLSPIWTQGITTGADTGVGTPNVYTWSTAIDGNDQADWVAVSDLTGTSMAAGHGFLVHVYADNDYNDETANGFPQNLSVTGSEYASGVSPIMNSNAAGWTLLGNPFASAVAFNQISPTNLDDILYIWNPNDDDGDVNGGTEPDQNSGSWNTWNGSVGDVSGGRIAPFQGFLVQNNGNGSVTFTQSSKTSTATAFLGKESRNQFVRLELEGKGMKNSAWMEFRSDGSLEKSDGDAWELTPLSSRYALLATRKDDGSLLDIGRYPLASELEIPLITEATQTGWYTLSVTDFETPGQTLYLNDLHTGVSIILEKDTQYEFEMNQTAKAPTGPFSNLKNEIKKQVNKDYRFVISSERLDLNPLDETPEKFTLDQNYPNPFNPVTVINYQLPRNSNVRLEVFDMSGRHITTLINSQQNAGIHSVKFDGSNLSSGVYMYRLEASGISLTKKLTLIK